MMMNIVRRLNLKYPPLIGWHLYGDLVGGQQEMQVSNCSRRKMFCYLGYLGELTDANPSISDSGNNATARLTNGRL